MTLFALLPPLANITIASYTQKNLTRSYHLTIASQRRKIIPSSSQCRKRITSRKNDVRKYWVVAKEQWQNRIVSKKNCVNTESCQKRIRVKKGIMSKKNHVKKESCQKRIMSKRLDTVSYFRPKSNSLENYKIFNKNVTNIAPNSFIWIFIFKKFPTCPPSDTPTSCTHAPSALCFFLALGCLSCSVKHLVVFS